MLAINDIVALVLAAASAAYLLRTGSFAATRKLLTPTLTAFWFTALALVARNLQWFVPAGLLKVSVHWLLALAALALAWQAHSLLTAEGGKR